MQAQIWQIAAAARATGMAPSVIGRGIADVRAIEDGTAPSLPPSRSRRPGGGRKKTTEKDPTLLPDLKALVESTTRGDPQSPLLWTARSQRNIVATLKAQGHQTSMKMVSRLLKEIGYSLQANRKRLEGNQWVLSFPYPLRFLFASRPAIMGQVLGIV